MHTLADAARLEHAMKILATFDGSKFSESVMAQLTLIAGLPAAEFTFLAVAHEPHGRRQKLQSTRPEAMAEMLGTTPVVVDVPAQQWAENKGQAIERRRAQLEDYLHDLAARLPSGTTIEVNAQVSDDPAQAIVDAARQRGVDVIVMATHSRGPLAQALFGSVTEQVVRSGVAPVLVVHPTTRE